MAYIYNMQTHDFRNKYEQKSQVLQGQCVCVTYFYRLSCTVSRKCPYYRAVITACCFQGKNVRVHTSGLYGFSTLYQYEDI